MAQPQLLVFDWDGTLADSTGFIVAVIQATARDLGWPEPEPDRVRSVIGLSLDEAIARAMPEASPQEVRRFAGAYRERYLAAPEGSARLYPGVADMLAQLEAQGYWMAVATGKGRAGLDAALKASGISGHFLVTRSAEETRSKPHPAMLESILDETGLYPEQALMLGDTRFDLEMAANAGVSALGVLGGAHERKELERAGPAVILESLPELQDWLRLRD